jgi:hypothetical protein
MKRLLIFLSFFVVCASSVVAQKVLSLSGIWDFAVGETPRYNDHIQLPGSMLTNGKGDDVDIHTQWTGSLYDSSYFFNPYMERYRQAGQMKFPFFLTPEKHYVGYAWYRRSVYVPKSWKDQRITLFLERPHIETTVYVNGKEVGHQMSLSTPHRYDVTRYVKRGKRNEIAICVYNGIENVCVGQDSHSVTDQTQGNWNGITGRIELQAQWKKLNIKGVSVKVDSTKITLPGRWVGGEHIEGEKVQMPVGRVTVSLENHTDGLKFFPLYDYDVTCTLRETTGAKAGKVLMTRRMEAQGDQLSADFPLGHDIKMWDEHHPNLYQLTITAGEDKFDMLVGFRQVDIKGRQMYINGYPIFLRGTVENCCFPETGYPPTDEESWMKIFMKCKEYGLNHVRFHSYCPPEAAFFAADRVGIYLQPEGPSWPNHGVRLRRGQKIDEYLLEESKRIIDEYGYHPSFVMMAAGNEPAGDWVTYCNDWVKKMHKYDPTKVYCGASVGGGWAWDDGSEYHVKGGARGLEWERQAPSSDDDYYSGIEFPRNYKSQTPNQSPIIAHEQGQWCAFPDFKEISQYKGAYKARNFEIFRDLLSDNGMESMAEKFLMASGKLQVLCYKYEIERNLRTKDYAGFQLLSLNDYSGQGTALVGPLNVHWGEKGYCNAEDWRQFCSRVVLLARFPRFVYTSNETLRVPLQIYNALWSDIVQSTISYSIIDEQQHVWHEGMFRRDTIRLGKECELGVVEWKLDAVKAPTKLTLWAHFGKDIKNCWDFWVYPEEREVMSDKGEVMSDKGEVMSADSLDAEALQVLNDGGTVLLTAAGRVTLGSDVVQHYLPVFWNTSWFKMRPPHTTGAYIEKTHPLFKHGFPTDDWSNLNWWELLNKAQVMNLMELPKDYQSPIQPIDTWHISRKLGMLVEAKVLNGKLLMTTMDISSDLEHRIVARQMRHAILDYMQSSDFNPSLVLDVQTIRHFYTKQGPKVSMFTNDSPDELKPKLK